MSDGCCVNCDAIEQRAASVVRSTQKQETGGGRSRKMGRGGIYAYRDGLRICVGDKARNDGK